MLSYPVIISVTIVSLVVISVVVFLVSGSFTAILVVLALAVIIYMLLQQFGVINVKVRNGGIDFDYHETVPAPESKSHDKKHKETSVHIKEVFYVSGNNYTYNDAPAVCAAYGAELASYDQIQEAFSLGAEWCGYGWSAAGLALYPTQESTWLSIQKEADESKRTACGRPGINGGYFDPTLKFGVNCYGTKPANKGIKFPQPVPGTDTSAVDKFKKMLSSMKISSFNRDIWSEQNVATHATNTIYGDIKKAGANIERDIKNDL
jgi:hypothetical protein